MGRTVCPELVGLAGPFTRIARAMSSEWRVHIVPSGARCDTDGEVIHIPFTSDYLPSEMRQVLHGLLDHEVCHVAEERRHREAARKTPIQLLNAESDRRARLLFNVVEDVRIEKRYSRQYVGVAQNIAALNLKAAGDAATMPYQSWWKGFAAAMILRAHDLPADWAEDDFGEYLAACEPELERMRDGVGEWGDASYELAKSIFAKVKDRAEEERKPEGEGDGAAKKGEGGDEGDGESDASRSPDDEPDGFDMLEGVRGALEEYVIHDARAHRRYIPHPKAHALDAVQESEENLAVYEGARSEVMPQIRALRQRQRALVSSWVRRKIRPGLERGHVDDTVLSDVRLGATDVFAELTRKRLLNTAITGLVDCSGSMGDNRRSDHGAYYALRTAVALAESWSSLGIANEWLGFTAFDYVSTGIAPADLTGPFFCRPPLRHLVFKAFDEPLRDVRARFGGIIGRGSNVDGEAVVWAWRRLMARTEKRRILVVICDGQPATWNGCADQQEVADELALQTHLRDAVSMATKSGIEVIGIGAGTPTPRAYFNRDTGAKFVHVRSIATLAFDVYKVMSQRVTDLA